jgi:cyclopropane-fatty-acyl-phospholipid synthase
MNSPTISLPLEKIKKAKKTSRFSLTYLARKLVLKQLKQLHTGCIVVNEENRNQLFGQPLDPGSELYAELTILDPDCYKDIMLGGSIGAAEAFMTGDWVTPDLTKLVRVMVRNMDILDKMEVGLAALSKPLLKGFHYLNKNTEKGAKRNIAAHYDLGNDFFKLFLDPTMTYSAGIFTDGQTSMEQASINKLEKICTKLQLKETDHLLEIGTGWGSLAIYAAKHFGCQVTTTTISEQQYSLARQRILEENLADKITLIKQDYRQLSGQFDKLVSVEMVEALGWQYYGAFFKKCSSMLKPKGSMLIQAITTTDQRYNQTKSQVDFIQRYIFPGGCVTSINALITAAKNHSDMRLLHLQDFAADYARTLAAWRNKFNHNINKIMNLGYSKEFLRMWTYYLCYCEGGFAERAIGVAHLLFAKPEFR